MPREYAETVLIWLVVGFMLAACLVLLVVACRPRETPEAEAFDRELDELDRHLAEMEDFDNVVALEVDRGEIR